MTQLHLNYMAVIMVQSHIKYQGFPINQVPATNRRCNIDMMWRVKTNSGSQWIWKLFCAHHKTSNY